MKLYYRQEPVKFKWLLLCRRCDQDRPKYVHLPEGTNDGFHRWMSYVTLYIRFPWKVWAYSINNDADEWQHPLWCISFRWMAQPGIFGVRKPKAKNAHTAR